MFGAEANDAQESQRKNCICSIGGGSLRLSEERGEIILGVYSDGGIGIRGRQEAFGGEQLEALDLKIFEAEEQRQEWILKRWEWGII